ncbi:MAG: alpha/beta hydrolase [Kiritimatiellaeota bacterium]|nr:alpha/beta hydrolase [Kiritimatiellota bacterium]
MKYPVILVHGIVAHDRGGIVNFWGRIPKRLKENGINVFLGNTDSWGDYESNAKALKATVERVLHETSAEKVNIIAHSKGGLDARYFIWKYAFGDRVASLTTLSTPHHGTEIADLIFKPKIVHSLLVRKALGVFGKLYGDINPDIYNLNRQLTTEKMKAFNQMVGMDEKVYYQSMYSTLRNAFDDLMFFYSYLYIKSVSGANDGVVSERAATWGNHVVKIAGGISHAEIVDYKRKKIAGISIPEIYMGIIDGLRGKGF